MTNGELYSKTEQLGILAVQLWMILSEPKHGFVKDLVTERIKEKLPEFVILAEELGEYL